MMWSNHDWKLKLDKTRSKSEPEIKKTDILGLNQIQIRVIPGLNHEET